MEKKLKYSNLITKKEVESWKTGSIQFLDGCTGSGKTYFITYTLAKHLNKNRKILFLTNRSALNKDVVGDVEKYGTSDKVTVMNYQKLENLIINRKDVGSYDFVVCDEAHYFIEDSNFNKTTNLSFDWVMEQKNSRIIFMSATFDGMEQFLRNENQFAGNENISKERIGKTYVIPTDYSYVKKLELMYSHEQIEERIYQLLEDTDDKIIYFANSTDKAYSLYKELGSDKAHFYCSKNNDFSKYSEEKCVVNGSFEKRLLITTVAMDNGVNITDKNVKHVISEVLDLNKLQQCMGRRRVDINDENDQVNFYIRLYNGKEVNSYLSDIKKQINVLKLFTKNYERFEQEYIIGKKNVPNVLTQTPCGDNKFTYTVNRIYARKLAMDMLYYNNIIGFGDKDKDRKDIGYANHKRIILQRFNTINKENVMDCKLEQERERKDALELYLESIVDKLLDKEKQLELIEKIDLKDRYGRQQKSVSTLNAYLQEIYNMQLISKTKLKMVDGKRKRLTYWEVSYKE